MFVGAMGGSTSGGMKLIRLIAVAKYAYNGIKAIITFKSNYTYSHR